MKNFLKRFLRIQSSFVLVMVLTQVLIIVLAVLFTRLTLHTIDANEAEKRESVTTFVNNRFDQGGAGAVTAILTIADDERLMALFQKRDGAGLYAATSRLYGQLKKRGISVFSFHTPDFKTLLRVHNPAIHGDNFTATRPMLVSCIGDKKIETGLEQGRTGWGFRAAEPAFVHGAFAGCIEMGTALDHRFLETLNANHAGRWAIINLQRGKSLTRDATVVASLNEPKDSTIFERTFSTPEHILKSLQNMQTYHEYDRESEEMSLYIPIKDFRGDVALYVRYESETPYYAAIHSILVDSIVISLIGMLLCGTILWILYRQIRGPVVALVAETEKIKNFDLKDKVDVPASLAELQVLIEAFGDMKLGLQSFQKYVPATLVRQLIETNQEAIIGGKMRELTILFTDVAGFTSITESLAPNDLTAQLSEYFDVVTNVILECNGTVDKYIGDAVMAFWGAPYEMEDHALQACRAALYCQRQIEVLAKRWRAEGKHEFPTRIGINTGEIIVGNIGSDQRLSYTVIGDAVNLASRLEGLNKEYLTQIIISGETYEQCKAHIEVRLLDFVVVKGKSQPVRIYELIGERGDVSPKQKEFITNFQDAIECYLNRDWDKAIRLFTFLAEYDRRDYPVKVYLDRCQRFKEVPPGAEWNGEVIYTTK